MKNTSLYNFLSNLPTEVDGKTAIVSNSNSLSYGNWCFGSIRLKNKSILLHIEDITILVKMLIALDGYADTICPLTTQISDVDFNHILSQHKFDFIITDKHECNLDSFSQKKISQLRPNDLDLTTSQSTEFQNITTWLVPTSGTTSKPKLVSHTFKTLAAASIHANRDKFQHEVWALFYDPVRYAGYQVLLKALISGHTLIVPHLKQTIAKKVQMCIENNVTHISATATLWRKILMCPTAQNIPLRHIILGGEAADQPTLNALKKKYPKAKLTHVYASTEAGVAMSVSDGMAGFPISFTDSSNSKAQVKIENKRLFVKSKSSAYAYIGKTKLNDVDGWIDTGDLVLVDGNRFFVIGRASGIVNVGGDKVVPEKVRQLLLQHPKVVDAHVYGKKNPFTGMLLAADVQLIAGSEPKNAQEELQVFIRSKLPKTHEPKIIHLVEDIKTNSTGKVEQRK